MIRQYYQLNENEFEQTPGDCGELGVLWSMGHKELETIY